MKGLVVEQIIGRGVSAPETRLAVVDYILTKIKPKVVFDIGMGIGCYGAAIKSIDQSISMIGLDAWLPYLAQDWAVKYYDARIHCTIQELLTRKIAVNSDLTIAMDVVEHLPLEDAVELLSYHRHMIVSTPLFDYKQGMVGGNPYEEHRSIWTEEALQNIGYIKLFEFDHESHDGQRGKIGAFERRL